MRYYETETTAGADGGVRLADDLHFTPGARLRVMVVELADAAPPDDDGKLPMREVRRRLAGTVVSYGDVMAPAYTDEEMEAFANAPLLPDQTE